MWVLLLVLSVYGGACCALAWFYVSHRSPGGAPEVAGVSSVSIPLPKYALPVFASDSLLQDRFDGSVVFVMVHGYGGSPRSWQALAREFVGNESVAVVLPWMAGHGENPCSRVGFGRPEAQEVIGTVKWVREKVGPRPRIVLVGVSLGAAACWLASEDLEDEVYAIVSESTFASLDETSARWLDLVMPKGSIVLRPVLWISELLSGSRASTVRPVDAAASWRGRPGLIIHAQDDILMPQDNADRLAAASQLKVWVVPHAGHAQVVKVAAPEYARRILELAGTNY
ncbi:MAG: alpha/beta fold hydrolase [Chthonomonas sp.]|nr:alpha/beta fold hydrolase [Chthonomonas sp.]